MQINVTITEKDLRKIVLEYLTNTTGFNLSEDDVKIEVKSKQNYKSEWESAEFRASVSKLVI